MCNLAFAFDFVLRLLTGLVLWHVIFVFVELPCL